MTEKVKIPQEVANAIENFRNAEFSDYGIIAELVNQKESSRILNVLNEREIIRDWTYLDSVNNPDKLLSALVNGWGIEPEPLELGEWAKFKHYGDEWIAKVEDARDSKTGKILYLPDYDIHACARVRYYNAGKASEREAEKEIGRRKWAEIEEGDVLRKLPMAHEIAVYQGEADDESILVNNGSEQYIWRKTQVELYAKKVGASNA